jgi:CheY-like chemotaxis protein
MEPLPETKVLIVEDNSDDKDLLLRQINKAGFEAKVKVIEDGRQAISFLESEGKSLIALFLDLQLPGADGLTVLESLRSFQHLKRLPVIVMTSSNDPLHLDRCRRLGVTSYVQKPVTFPAFAKALADTFHAYNAPDAGIVE